MIDLIDKKVIQDALIEKISRLNSEGEKSIQIAREFIRFKRYVDGITPISQEKHQLSEEIPTNAPTDLISRQDALAAIRIRLQDWAAYGDEQYRRGLYACEDMIISLPSKADRPKGVWTRIEWGGGDMWLCSECGETTTMSFMGKPRYEYCPMCGADMRGADHGTDDNVSDAEEA